MTDPGGASPLSWGEPGRPDDDTGVLPAIGIALLAPDLPNRFRRLDGPLLAAALAPVLFSVLQHRIGLVGLPGEAVRYAARTTDVLISLAVEPSSAVGLGRTGRG